MGLLSLGFLQAMCCPETFIRQCLLEFLGFVGLLVFGLGVTAISTQGILQRCDGTIWCQKWNLEFLQQILQSSPLKSVVLSLHSVLVYPYFL